MLRGAVDLSFNILHFEGSEESHSMKTATIDSGAILEWI